MEGIELFGRIVGAFYVFAGALVLWVGRAHDLMDQMLAALGGDKDAGPERLRTRILRFSAVLTLVGGVALAMLSRWALVLFAANILAQAAYLVWAARALPPESEEEALGRRRTRNALIVYMVAFTLVLTLERQGHLLDWAEPLPLAAMALVLAAAIGFVWWAGRQADGLPRLGFDPAELMQPGSAEDLPPYDRPERVRLSPRRFDYCLYDAATGEGVPLNRLDLDPALLDRLYRFEDAYEMFYDDEAEVLDALVFPDEAKRADWLAEGAALATELETVFGPGNATFVPPAVTRIGQASTQ